MSRSSKLFAAMALAVVFLPGTALVAAPEDPPLPSYAQAALKGQEQYVNGRWPAKWKAISEEVARLRKERRAGRAVAGAQNALRTIASLDKALAGVLPILKGKDVPEQHSRYRAMRGKVEDGRAKLADLAKECESLKSRAERGMDVKNYPDHQRDLAEFKRIGARFASFEGWDKRAEKLEAFLTFREAESGRLIGWYNERVRFYGWFLEAGTKESEALKTAVMQARRSILAVNARLESYTRGYAATAMGQLGTVERMAERSRSSGRFDDKLARTKLASAREIHARLERLRGAGNDTVKKLTSQIDKTAKLVAAMAAAHKDAVATERGDEIIAMLNDAEKHAQTALSKKDANWMKGARDKLGAAKARLDKLAQIAGSHAKVAEARKRYIEVAANVQQARTKLKDIVIQQTRAPRDAYEGPGQAKWKAMVLRKWKELYPKDTVRDVRFPMRRWRRTTEWRFDDARKAWYKVDKSVLRVTVIVLTSPRIATLYPCYCNVDHITGETSVGAHTKKDAYDVQEMLVENLDK